MSVGPGDELSCEELVELATDYLEECLGPAGRARIVAHLAACAGCAEYLEQLRSVTRLAAREEPLEAPELEARLLESFRAWKKQGGGGPSRPEGA